MNEGISFKGFCFGSTFLFVEKIDHCDWIEKDARIEDLIAKHFEPLQFTLFLGPSCVGFYKGVPLEFIQLPMLKMADDYFMRPPLNKNFLSFFIESWMIQTTE